MVSKKDNHPTRDQMINYGLERILRSFGKGDYLRGAVAEIVNQSAAWGAENIKRELAKKEREKTKNSK